jgi:hypothetical protein
VRQLDANPVPRWEAVEALDLSRICYNLSLLDVIAGDGALRFHIRFHGALVTQVFGSPDCCGEFLYESLPGVACAQKLAAYRRATDSNRPVYTIHNIVDRDRRLVHHERPLLPLLRDGDSVDRILTSFEFICPDGASNNRDLMTAQGTPPKLRLSATIEPHALG